MIRSLKKQLSQLRREFEQEQEQKKIILENNRVKERVWTVEETLNRFSKPIQQTIDFIKSSETDGFKSLKYYREAFELNEHFSPHNNSR